MDSNSLETLWGELEKVSRKDRKALRCLWRNGFINSKPGKDTLRQKNAVAAEW